MMLGVERQGDSGVKKPLRFCLLNKAPLASLLPGAGVGCERVEVGGEGGEGVAFDMLSFSPSSESSIIPTLLQLK